MYWEGFVIVSETHIDHSKAVAAKMERVCTITCTTVTKVEGLFPGKGPSGVCVGNSLR